MSAENEASDETKRAEQSFRPFFDGINFHDPQFTYFAGVLNDDYPFLKGKNKDIHVFVIKRDPKEGRHGYGMLFPWDKKSETDYIFTIYLNPSLFPDGQYNSAKLRKVVGIHEAVHCIAAVLNILEIESKAECENFMKKLRKKFTLGTIAAKEIKKISKEKKPGELMYSTTSSQYPQNLIYEDEHYRPEGDIAAINYSKLFKQLLFSRDTFEAYMGAELPALKNKIKNGHEKAYEKAYKDVLNRYKDKIADEKNLYVDFVAQRIAEIFSTYFWE